MIRGVARTSRARLTGAILALFVGAAATPQHTAAAQRLTLARGVASEYVIVIAREASLSTRFAAEELQRFLGEITGAAFPVRANKFVEKVGMAAVKAGYYPIEVEYFQAGGDAALSVGLLGPELPRRELSPAWLFHRPRP